jgi:hypothetical protein
MLRKNSIWGVAVVTVIAVLGTPEAKADLRLRVDNGSTGSVVTDNMTGDSNALVGTLGYSVSNSIFQSSGTGVQQPPAFGLNSGQVGGLDLNSITLTNTGTGTQVVRLFLQANNYTGGASGQNMGVSFAVGGTATGISSITFRSWADPSNAVPAYGADQALGPIGAVGSIPGTSVGGTLLSFGNGGFSNSGSPLNFSFLRGATNWSLFLEADITFTDAGTVSFDAHETVTVPEPATIAAVLTGVPFLGAFMWRRRKAINLSA